MINNNFRNTKMTVRNVREEILAVFGSGPMEADTNRFEMFS